MSIADIVTNIDGRLAAIDAELTNLKDARAALLNGAQRPAVTKPRRTRRTPAKPSHEVVPAGKLIALLASSQGMRTRELARATNGDPAQVLALLKEQEGAGQVRRSGTRAATRWHVITDEDRIAARAAELQATSKRARARKS